MRVPSLLIATHNKWKVEEFRRLLGLVPYNLITPDDVNLNLKVEESGETFQENALLKAHEYSKVTGILSVADDSGIEVDALGGEPGVYSARFGGPDLTDEQRVQLLLERLGDEPWEQRACRYRVAMVLAWPSGETMLFEGALEGLVAFKPKGTNGFGYDPVFYLPDHGKTVAELSDAGKDHISHRGQASKLLESFLADFEGISSKLL